jgi:hypothetical protein
VQTGAQARDLVDWATLVVASIAALGTVGAVLAALFLPRFEERRTRPQLTLSTEPEGGMGMVVGSGGSEWVNLRIHNARGKRMARDVEVRVLAWTVRPDATHVVVEDLGLVVDAAGTATVTTVPPGHARSVGFLVIEDVDEDQEGPGVFAHFRTAPPEAARLSRMEPPYEYPTYVTVTGSNFDALVYEGALGFIASDEPIEDRVAKVVSIGWAKPLRRVPDIPANALGVAWINGRRV